MDEKNFSVSFCISVFIDEVEWALFHVDWPFIVPFWQRPVNFSLNCRNIITFQKKSFVCDTGCKCFVPICTLFLVCLCHLSIYKSFFCFVLMNLNLSVFYNFQILCYNQKSLLNSQSFKKIPLYFFLIFLEVVFNPTGIYFCEWYLCGRVCLIFP